MDFIGVRSWKVFGNVKVEACRSEFHRLQAHDSKEKGDGVSNS